MSVDIGSVPTTIRSLVRDIWANAKTWQRVRLGPISFLYRFSRHPSAAARPVVMDAYRQAVSRDTNKTLETVMLIGVGEGFGYGVASVFALEAKNLILVSRNHAQLQALRANLPAAAHVEVMSGDATDERRMRAIQQEVAVRFGTPELVVYAVQNSCPGGALDTSVAAFEESWRSTCLGAFIVGKEAATQMIRRKHGTIVFTGSTSGLVAREGHLNLAVGKHGLRALSQVMARELGPSGIHVVHLVIDGDIADGSPSDESQISPCDIAHTIMSIHGQPRSCWTSELDIRPHDERFWEHC